MDFSGNNFQPLHNQPSKIDLDSHLSTKMSKVSLSEKKGEYANSVNGVSAEVLANLVLEHTVTKGLATKKISIQIPVLILKIISENEIETEKLFLHIVQNELFMKRFEYLTDSSRPTEPLDAGLKFKFFTKRAKVKIIKNALPILSHFEDQNNFLAVQKGRMGGSSSITGTGETFYSVSQIKKATKNWNEAELFVRKLAIKHNETREMITLDDIGTINKTLTDELEENTGSPGELRDFDIFTGQRWYLPGELVERAMEEFVENLHSGFMDVDNAIKDPEELAAAAYQKIVSIHPFFDGNGRTSRLIMDYVLMRFHRLPPQFDTDVNAAIFCNVEDADPNNVHPLEVQKKVAEGIVKTQELFQI